MAMGSCEVNAFVCERCKDCPMSEAPDCFKWALIRALELGGPTYVPTNWKGFADYFCPDISASSAEELVKFWVKSHQNCAGHTIRKVFEFAEKRQHRRLMDSLVEVIQEHLIPGHTCTPNPAECFRQCDRCCNGGCSSTDPVHIPTGQHVGQVNASVVNIYNVLSPSSPSSTQDYLSDANADPLDSPLSSSLVISDTVSATLSPLTASPVPGMTRPARRDQEPAALEGSPRSRRADIPVGVTQRKPSDMHKQTDTSEDKQDIFYELSYRLFHIRPYYLFHRFYHRKVRDSIRCLFAIFFGYQLLAMTLITMCSDGGVKAVFRDEENMYREFLHRLLILALRLCGRVLTPLFFLFQLDTIAAEPKIPESGLTNNTAIERIVKVCEAFSSEEEVAEVRKLVKEQPQKVIDTSEHLMQRHLKMRIPLLNSVLFTGLVLYLGAFLAAEEKIMRGGVCNFDFMYLSIVYLPFLNTDIHLSALAECISIFIIILLIGVVKEFYCYENRIATCAVLIGREGGKLYKEVRRRWGYLDSYCYGIGLGLMGFAVLSLKYGKAFTPSPSHKIKPGDLINWYFWITVLSSLLFLSFSPNRMAKTTCLIGYVIIAVFISLIKVEGLVISATGDCLVILLYVAISALFFNIIFTLYRCHCYYYKQTSNPTAYRLKLLCLLLLLILPICVAAIVTREAFHFAHFLIKSEKIPLFTQPCIFNS